MNKNFKFLLKIIIINIFQFTLCNQFMNLYAYFVAIYVNLLTINKNCLKNLFVTFKTQLYFFKFIVDNVKTKFIVIV